MRRRKITFIAILGLSLISTGTAYSAAAEIIEAANNQPARRGIDAPWFPKGIKLHVNDPKIGDRFGSYQKLFDEIFSSSQPAR